MDITITGPREDLAKFLEAAAEHIRKTGEASFSIGETDPLSLSFEGGEEIDWYQS